MIISKTPFRVSFVGGGTDIDAFFEKHGGSVISTAINKYMYITVNRRFDDDIRLSYSRTEIVKTVEELQHDIVRECLRMVGIDRGIEITSVSDIPKGTGMGSSSAFTVGLLNALYLYKGVQLSAFELAERACKIEIDILGNPIGKQDQFAAALGGVNYIEFEKDGSVRASRIELTSQDYITGERKLMLFYTGGTRSASSLLSKQKESIPDNERQMISMKALADDYYQHVLRHGFDERLGLVLNEGWEIKRTLQSGISSEWIDECYAKAIHAGALGGKLLGAGGSGFLLLYVPECNQDAVRKSLGLKELPFSFSSYGTRIICCD